MTLDRSRVRTHLIVVLVLLVPIGAHRLWDYIELRRLVAEVEQVVARREPVDVLRVTGVDTSPGGNAAGRFYVAAALAASSQPRTGGPATFDVDAWLAGWKREPPASEQQRLRAMVEAVPEALALADRAASLEFRRLPPGTEYSYRTSHLFALSSLLRARTVSLSWQGRGDEAAAAALSSLTARRALRVAPFQPLGLEETAALLSLSQPSADSLARLQRALEAEDARERIVEELLFARAGVVDTLWRRHYGPDPATPADYRLPMRSFFDTIRRPLRSRRAVASLREWARLIEAARKPWPDRIDAMSAARVEQAGPGASFGMSPPGVSMTVRAIVMDRCSIVLLAIERFRRDNGGALTDSLEQLVPRYLGSIPVDPFTGAPLRFARNETSFTVYSVAADKVDNGGDLTSELSEDEKRRFGPRQLRGRDAGLRVLTRR